MGSGFRLVRHRKAGLPARQFADQEVRVPALELSRRAAAYFARGSAVLQIRTSGCPGPHMALLTDQKGGAMRRRLKSPQFREACGFEPELVPVPARVLACREASETWSAATACWLSPCIGSETI